MTVQVTAGTGTFFKTTVDGSTEHIGHVYVDGLSSGTITVDSLTSGTVVVSSLAGGTIDTVASLTSGTVVVSSLAGGTIDTIASLTSGTVAVSSITGGTITTVGTVTSITSGTVYISCGLISVSSAQLADLGQAAMTASVPVVIASDQSAVTTGGITPVYTYIPTISTATMDAGDVLAETALASSFFRQNGGTGVIQSLLLVDETDLKSNLDIYIMDSSASMGTAGSAPSISDANAATILGVIEVSSTVYNDLGGVSVAPITGIGMCVNSVASTASIGIAIIANTSGTYNSSAIVLRIGMLED